MKNKITNYQVSKNLTNEVKKLDKKISSYSESFFAMLEKLIKRADLEVPEYGDFAPVYENFANINPDLNIGKYQLKVFKMPKASEEDETKRFIMAEVFAPAGDYKADLLIGSGTKDEIMKQLQNPEFVDTLNNAYIELVEFMHNR